VRGLDDALDRLARRDQLRRRAAGESAGTPPAVTELVEAIAAVVGRNPTLAVTVGVQGAGDPTLLHFAVEDGIVQVSADNPVAQHNGDQHNGDQHNGDQHSSDQRSGDQRHDDVIDVDLEEPYTPPANGYHYEQPVPRYEEPAPQPHPFAATPPPEVPPQAPHPAYTEQTAHPAYAEHRAAETPQQRSTDVPHQRQTPEEPERGLLPPLPEPIPLQVNEEETEMAARRLAALLREDPTLLRSPD
jgi:hypothetical protein